MKLHPASQHMATSLATCQVYPNHSAFISYSNLEPVNWLRTVSGMPLGTQRSKLV